MTKATAVVAPAFLCGLAALLREGDLLGAGRLPTPHIRVSDPLHTYLDCFMEDFLTGDTSWMRSGGCSDMGDAWGWTPEFRETFTWDEVL